MRITVCFRRPLAAAAPRTPEAVEFGAAPTCSGAQSNVRMVTARSAVAAPAPPQGVVSVSPDVAWSIRDSEGEVLEMGIASRAEALRRLGCHASRGASLPIRAWTGGVPNGDRIG